MIHLDVVLLRDYEGLESVERRRSTGKRTATAGQRERTLRFTS